VSRTTLILILGSICSMGATCMPHNPWTVQSEVTYSLNPNGSGKAEVDAHLNFPLDLKPNEYETETQSRVRRAVAANAARDLLLKSRTIDAWRDVSWGIDEDGRLHFTGTAFFPDLDELGLGTGWRIFFGLGRGDSWREVGGKYEFTYGMIPGPRTDSAAEATPPAPPAKQPPKLTEEEVAERIRDAKQRYRDTRPRLLKQAKKRKGIVRIRLPGEIEATEGSCRKIGSDLVEAGYDGMVFLRKLDALFADDARLRQLAREAGGRDVFRAAFREAGPARHGAGPRWAGVSIPGFRVVVGGEVSPVFDYATEVAAAEGETAPLLKELAELSSLDAIRGGPGRAIWLETSSGVFRSGPYPWRSVICPSTSPFLLAKHVVPVLGPLGYSYLTVHQGPVYLRYPYSDERAGTAFIVPEFVNLYGRASSMYLGSSGPYRALVSELDSAEGGDRSLRLSGWYLESGDESGSRAEYRLDLPGYFGFEGGAFDVGGRERTYLRFSNAFIMNTRAVASLDLGAAWLDSEADDARFEWGVSADLFPRKPWLVHFSWHSLDGSYRPSETRAAVGVALKALELTAGWTRDRGPLGEEHFFEIGARLWWAF